MPGLPDRLVPDIRFEDHFPSSSPYLSRVTKFSEKMLAAPFDYPYNKSLRADVAQLVEHNLAKVGVAGSNPVVRSI